MCVVPAPRPLAPSRNLLLLLALIGLQANLLNLSTLSNRDGYPVDAQGHGAGKALATHPVEGLAQAPASPGGRASDLGVTLMPTRQDHAAIAVYLCL